MLKMCIIETSMMSTLLLKNIKKIYRVSSEKPPSILIKDGIIQEIAAYEDILRIYGKSALESASILDCSDTIAVPGFVDSHTHLLFCGSRENELYLRAGGYSYMEIMEKGGGIYSTVKAVRSVSEEVLIENGLKFLDKALSFGTTTIEIKSGYGLDYKTEKKMLAVINRLNDLHPIDIIPTFLVHTVPRDISREKYIDLVANQMIPQFREYTDWFDIFLEKGVFDIEEGEFLISRALHAGYRVGIHTNQIHDIGGVELASELGVRHVDHLEVLSEKDAVLIAENENLYPVFLPSAESFVFSENIGQIHQLLNIPSRIVLATDFNPGSSPVLSPQLILTLAVLRYRISNPYLLLDSFTENPARMLDLGDRGRIKKGAKADIVCLELENFEQIPYYGTLNFIKFVIKDGTLRYAQNNSASS